MAVRCEFPTPQHPSLTMQLKLAVMARYALHAYAWGLLACAHVHVDVANAMLVLSLKPLHTRQAMRPCEGTDLRDTGTKASWHKNVKRNPRMLTMYACVHHKRSPICAHGVITHWPHPTHHTCDGRLRSTSPPGTQTNTQGTCTTAALHGDRS